MKLIDWHEKMGTMEAYYFWGEMPYSQWTVSKDQFTAVVYSDHYKTDGIITRDGRMPLKFNCAEQYMMLRKALHFKDFDAADRIMAATDPREQKAIGKNVQGFTDKSWDEVKMEVVYTATKLKYSQNPKWRKELVDLVRSGKYLVEASPYDKIWGIGINVGDALNGAPWKGENLLGIILTNAAFDFLKEEQKILYTDTTHSCIIPAIDIIQSKLKESGIDVDTAYNIDLIENQLWELITGFLEEHYDRGEYSSYN